MARPFGREGGLGKKVLVTGALGYALYETWTHVAPGSFAPEWYRYAWGAGALIMTGASAGALREIAELARNAARIWRAFRPRQSLATAAWLTKREARKAGLGKTQGVFLGILDGLPLFIPNAVHGLCCAPARKGKTTSLVVPALSHDIGMSRIVADMKGDLSQMTVLLVRDEHGHEVLVLDPARITGQGNARYNPLQIIRDALEHSPHDALSDTRSLARQLHPDPVGGSREPFWPEGTRKLLTFVLVASCALREPWEGTLFRAYEILTDDAEFDGLLDDALRSDVLGGEIASLARNIASTRRENPKHFESFREGAVQSLAPFGPSGHLAESVTTCDFRFRDLKRKRMTIFLVCDPSRIEVFAPWTGLIVWSAIRELVRERNAIPVQFILDEFTNYRLNDLPGTLTALGGYGIRCWLVVQELEEIARVYGREALATILSQCDVKQFFGIASQKTAELVSQMLGQQMVATESFGLGSELRDLTQFSMGVSPRNLMTPDELRRLPEDEEIIFIRNLKPARALKAGYHEVAPWRDQVKPNRMYGDAPFIGKLKMRIVAGRARATRAGRRSDGTVGRPFFRPLLAVAITLLQGSGLLFAGLLVASVLLFGWPHIRVEYAANGTGPYRSYIWCRYFGPPLVTEPFTRDGDRCPIVVWKKHEGGMP